MSNYILEAKGIVKQFPGVRALDGVDIKISKGEVHAIVGENGAGKSTLMLTLGGVYRPEQGELFVDSQKVKFSSAIEAQKHGISIVYQELSVLPNLTIAENIFANRQPTNRFNMINKNELQKKTTEMLKLFDMDHLDPGLLVKDLSMGNQQIVEILKAMSLNPKILILDEPTSSLTEVEVKQLFKNINILKNKGIAFIYISHYLHEIFEIADNATVLRDGKYICTVDPKEIDEEFLIGKMVGRKIENIYGEKLKNKKFGNVILKCEKISRDDVFKDISFDVKAGEIVGMSGLIGAGRTEIGRGIFGAEPITSGKMFLEGKEISVKNPRSAILQGIGYMSEDRKMQGLYLDFAIENNIVSNRLYEFAKNGFLQDYRMGEVAENSIKEFSIATPSKKQLVGKLSGGNQQKVLLSTWFGIRPKLLIVDEPTRGVDVGAKSEIYTSLRKLAASGVGIVMISSDLMEILGVSDRIVVIKEGRKVGEVPAEEATEEAIISMAASMNDKNNDNITI